MREGEDLVDEAQSYPLQAYQEMVTSGPSLRQMQTATWWGMPVIPMKTGRVWATRFKVSQGILPRDTFLPSAVISAASTM